MAFNLINFKKGTLARLNELKTQSGIEEGTFYLTIDENKETSRLYIGTSTTTALPVNSNIVTVTNQSELNNTLSATPFNDGDFAYVTNGNILAVKIGNQWRQINTPPSSSDYKFLTSADYSIDTSNGVATITWTGYRSDNDEVTADMTVTGTNGVTVSSSGTALTISGDPATLASTAVNSSNATTISLSSTGNTASGSIAVSGGNNITLEGAANNIRISAQDTTNSSLTVTNASNGFNITVQDSNNDEVSGTLNPTITYLTNEAGTTTANVTFQNGIAALDVYSKDEINRRLKALDGMTYKGTVGAQGSAATTISGISNVSIGDTYKVVSDLSSIPIKAPGSSTITTTGTAKLGDLLIANGTETNGVITSGLYYDIIPAGDDLMQTYSVVSDTYGIKIHDDVTNDDIGGIKLAAGKQIALSDSGTNEKTVTVAHADISSATNGNPTTATKITQSENTPLTINAVTGLTTNNGHVTGITITPYEVQDTNAALTEFSESVTAGTGNNAGKIATITTNATLTSGANTPDPHSASFSLASDNLAVTAPTSSQVKVNFVWDTF